ncbi:hypothetical protein [Methylobacterium sp. ID0610]|uniref:hypothetical protein n=1 Tax=Methylobacterium carpenticola TaxID=3344827 RepID=UPI0036ABE774
MSSFTLDARVRLAIALALTIGGRDRFLPPDQEAAARMLGLSGAEIDAACQGRSFDLRTSRALALALAVRAQDGERRNEERARAVRVGIAEEVCSQIESFAARLMAPEPASETKPVHAARN